MFRGLIVALSLAAPAKESAALYEQADEEFRAGDFEAASETLARLYGIDPRPEYLYLRAEVERLGGHCGTSVELYRRYIETGPEPRKVEQARNQVARCGEALEALARARKLEREGAFIEASGAVAQAYTVAPDPAHLVRRGDLERRGGQCRTALELYREYLDLEPDGDAAAAATEGTRACTSSPAPKPEHEEPPPLMVDAPPPSKPRHVLADPLGGALAGTGIVSLGVGLGLLGRALTLQAEARDQAIPYDDFERQRTRAYRWSGAGIGLISAGAALLVGAAIRYGLVARRRRSG